MAQGAPTVKQAVNMQVRFKTATANVSARLTLFALLLDDPELGNDEEHYAMQDLETRSEDETAIGSVHTSSSSSLGSQPPSIARNHTRGDVESVSDTSHGDEADEDTSDASGVRHYLGGGTGNGTTNEATTYAGIAAQAGSHNSGAHDNLEDNNCAPHNVVNGSLEYNTIGETLSGEPVTSDPIAHLNERLVGTQTVENTVDLGTDGIPGGQASSASDCVGPATVDYSITSLSTSGPDTADGSMGPIGEGDEIPGMAASRY